MSFRQTKSILAAVLFTLAVGSSARRAIFAPSLVHAQQAPPPPAADGAAGPARKI